MDKRLTSAHGLAGFLAVAVGMLTLARSALAVQAGRIDSINPGCAAVNVNTAFATGPAGPHDLTFK